MINYELFKSAFSKTEKMPKDKEEFMARAYFFYNRGRKDKETDLLYKIRIVVERFLTED